MSTEKIVIGVDNETRELSGEELAEFLAMRQQMQAELDAKREAEKQAAETRKAAIAHAKSLGFTDEMIAVMYPNLANS